MNVEVFDEPHAWVIDPCPGDMCGLHWTKRDAVTQLHFYCREHDLDTELYTIEPLYLCKES